MPVAPVEDDCGHVALAVAGGEEHEGLHGDPRATAVDQVVEHGARRGVGQLEEPELDGQVGQLLRRLGAEGTGLVDASPAARAVGHEQESVGPRLAGGGGVGPAAGA